MTTIVTAARGGDRRDDFFARFEREDEPTAGVHDVFAHGDPSLGWSGLSIS
jgi:hypothetical protein